MGASASNIASAQVAIAAEPEYDGYWKSDVKTGYRWVTAPIVSDETVTKESQPLSLPGLPGEIWGPYKKKFTKSIFGQKIFTPPESVDGVPILCRCRDIYQYVRSPDGGRIVNAMLAAAGSFPPACWEDSESLKTPFGGMTFRVTTRHPAFYEYMANRYGGIGLLMNAARFVTGGTRKKIRRKKRYTTRHATRHAPRK